MTLLDNDLEKLKSIRFSLIQKIIASIIAVAAVLTSFFDDMGVMKHIWIGGIAASLIFLLYTKLILPKLIRDLPMFRSSKFKANGFVLITSWILSSCCGSGIMAAFLNLIAISAFCNSVLPALPMLFFPIVSLIGSIIFFVLPFIKFMHYLVAIPISLILAAAHVMFLKNALNPPSTSNQHANLDVEVGTALDDPPKKLNMKEISKALFAIFISALVSVLIIYWVTLSVNPFWMRADRISKFETLNRLPHDQNMRVREVSSLDDLKYYRNKLKTFPVVIKPSICTTNSRNVMKCDNYKCLKDYLTQRLKETPQGAWVIQEYSHNLEGVVFYYKFPYMSSGAIKNIGIRDDSMKEVQTDVKGTKLTSQYWPGEFRKDFSAEYVTFFDKLAAKIPGYTGGRFDVMLSDSELKDPRGVEILELNVFFLGCIEEKIVSSALDELKRLRTSLFQIYIGIVNIVAGYNYLNAFGIMFKLPELINRTVMCSNHEHLFAKP